MKSNFQIDFVGIGASKAGTTWLGHILAEHPEICVSEPKEVHFFNDLIAFRNPIMKPNYSKGLDWYRKYFAHCDFGKIKGEITPRYCTDPVVPERLYAHNKKVKLLFCIRNPIDRIESQFNFYKHFVRIEDRSIDKAVMEEPEYLEMTRYAANILRFQHYFPLDQIHLVWFEDVIDRPEEVARIVFNFLGVNPDFIPPSLRQVANPGRRSRFSRLQFGIRKMSYALVALGFSGALHYLKRTRLKNWMMRLNSKPFVKEKASLTLRQFIVTSLKEDITRLEHMTGKNLSHWLTPL